MHRLRIGINEKYYAYPDITLTPEPLLFADDDFYNLLNPLVIIEILAEDTDNLDRSLKFRAYRELPSLKEYILVSQYEYCVESFHKNEKGEWIVGQTCTSLEDIYQFKSIDFQLSVAAIYDEVVIEIPKEEE